MSNEESLRRTLGIRLHDITRREPLPATYKHLLLQSPLPPPNIPSYGLYRKVSSDWRQCIETFLQTGPPAKKGKERDDLDEDKMRASFTLRENERHKQEGLVSGMIVDEVRKRRLEGIALGLQEREKKRALAAAALRDKSNRKIGGGGDTSKKDVSGGGNIGGGDIHNIKNDGSKSRMGLSIAEKVRKIEEEARRKAEESRRKAEKRDREIEERERERQRQRAKERERQREMMRKEKEEKERLALEKAREEALKKAREMETPQQALHRLYQPIFQVLWDMEFANLNWTNPFRIVYDKDNCAAMGVPDYTDIVKQPMNLTYIREKVEARTYETLQAFFADVELMISNALLYNSDPTNEYHLAAKEMKKKYKKMAKRVVLSVQHQNQQQQQQHHKESST